MLTLPYGRTTARPVEKTPGHLSIVDVVDRVLDKGIVIDIDPWVRASLVSVDLAPLLGRVVVASIDTSVEHWDALGVVTPVGAPPPRVRNPRRTPRLRAA